MVHLDQSQAEEAVDDELELAGVTERSGGGFCARGGSCWPFIGKGGGGGRAGANLPGRTVLGEARTAVAARPAMVVAVASTGRVGGAWRALVAPGKSGFVKQGARGWFWAEARRVGRPGGFAGVRRRRRRGAGRRRLKNRPVAIS